jgi:hypothetical protein
MGRGGFIYIYDAFRAISQGGETGVSGLGMGACAPRLEELEASCLYLLDGGRRKIGEESCDVMVKLGVLNPTRAPDSGIDPTCESQRTEGNSG